MKRKRKTCHTVLDFILRVHFMLLLDLNTQDNYLVDFVVISHPY